MEREYGEFVGVDSLYYARVTEDSDSAYTAEAPLYLAPAAEIAGEPEVNNTPTFYDNLPADTYITEGATKLTVTVSGVPGRKAALLLGKDYDEVTGRVYDSGKPNPLNIALGFRYDKGQSDYRYYWYLKGKFTGGAEEAKSKSGDVDIRTYQLTFTAVSTAHKWMVNGELKPLKRVFADTTESAFNPTGWFSQVQTPDTTSAPSELALSSITPADDATGVAIGSTIVLTFNNKIAADNIMLMSAAGAVIAASKTYNAAGKVMTITPSSNLSAGTAYLVAVAGVVDAYGQKLTAAVKNFTTAG